MTSKWGCLEKETRGGPQKIDTKEYVDEFFSKDCLPDSWTTEESVHEQLNEFVAAQTEAGRRVAVVTSGSTKASMDEYGLHYIDCESSGNRGAACAEGLLRRGYAVIFLYRDGSLLPFSRHFAKSIKNGAFMDLLKVDKATDTIRVDTSDSRKALFYSLLKEYQESQEQMLTISFETIQEYLRLLRAASQALNIAEHRGMLFLTAAVLNFYAPQSETRRDRLHYTDEKYSVGLHRAPNLRRMIRHVWCPKAFLVTFRLELTDSDTIESAHRDMETWGSNVVVGNNLNTRGEQLVLVTEQEDLYLTRPENATVETPLISTINSLHRDFLRQSVILRKSKELMLLSAKFAMMKENDVVGEDANGLKNVKFGPGIQIKSKRSLGDASPVYELKSIYQNESHSARGHIWKSVKDANSPSELLVVFSPAGTPNTIRDMWGDFWGGWAEAELQEFKQQLSQVSFSSAIDVISSPLTGDYSSAAAAVSYVWKKVGAAWSDGEQTRIRQSLQNVLSLCFHRGLEECTGLRQVEDILTTTPPTCNRSNTLTLDEAIDISEENLSAQIDKLEAEKDCSDRVQVDRKRVEKARSVRVHKTVVSYFRDMEQQGILDEVLSHLERGESVTVTGYSMGGMISQLFMLKLGEEAQIRGYDLSLIQMIGFGTPRIGDSGFHSRLMLLFCPSQLINVMHPSDTVHAFPPTSEGYEDSMLKVFLKQDGMGVGRRCGSLFSILPTTRSIDRSFERVFQAAPSDTQATCSFCNGTTHSTEQHRCRYCTQRGDHLGANCPNRNSGCGFCGKKNHCTGEHKCSVCSQTGHRGRECHLQRDVGTAELITYFRYHNFLYYNSVFKESAEFYT